MDQTSRKATSTSAIEPTTPRWTGGFLHKRVVRYGLNELGGEECSLCGPDGVYKGSVPDPDCQGEDEHFRMKKVRRICDGDSADDAEQRDDAPGDAEPQAESDDAADDARNAEPDGDDSQARDDSQATLHSMSPVPADDAELNGEPDDATDDAADDAELNGEPDDPHAFAGRLIDEAHVRLIIQMMTDRELAADINRAAGRDDAAQLISPLPLSHASRIRACIRGYRWREGILSRGDVTWG